MKPAASRAKHATVRDREARREIKLKQLSQQSSRIQGCRCGDLLLRQSVYPVGSLSGLKCVDRTVDDEC